MKLTFKDLKQQKFVIEAEPSETIGEVKAKIAAERGWDASLQKLIYSGKILKDEETVESYKVEEKGFIVCMVQKPKATPAPAAEASTPAKPPATPAAAVASTPAIPSAPTHAGANPVANVPETPTPAEGSTSEGTAQFNDPNALATGNARAAAIANMEGMGFPRADIDRAMRAAYNNPDRAVEYLLSGIPESVEPTAAALAATTPAQTANPSSNAAPAVLADIDDDETPINLFDAAAQVGRNPAAAAARLGAARSAAQAAGGISTGTDAFAAATATGDLSFLRDNPQFQQLRQLIQTQPQMLEPILQQVGSGNPGLAQLINAHPDQFLQLLSEDADEENPLPPGAHSVSVTEEERDAIDRLCSLGFERDLVIQAYFACDKNEDLAANFLFDQPQDGNDY